MRGKRVMLHSTYRQNETRTSVLAGSNRDFFRKSSPLFQFETSPYNQARMKHRLIPLVLLICGCTLGKKEEDGVFRYHLANEPQSLDPARLTSTDASYFFNNIMRGLYSYSNERGLEAEGAESCHFVTPLRLECKLAQTFWSDGSEVVADDYVRAFRRLLSAGGKNPSVELLKNLKNALQVHQGKLPPAELGMQAVGKDRLIFEFEKPDPDFLYKLTTSVLVPTKIDSYPERGKVEGLYFNGPYRVVQWTLGSRLHLEPNPYYKRGNPERPRVEILVNLDDEQTALNLYEQKTLTFLRRLPTTYIPKYKGRSDFHQIPLARFDYIGFGAELKDHPKLRSALAHGADYRELQIIYDALGIPGCPSLPEELAEEMPCVRFDLERAKRDLAEVPAEVRKKRFKLYFSKSGGDDIKKGMEWFQEQWKKNLGIQVDLHQTEQGVYLALLREKPPAIFRKGVGLERPTCLAALETFAVDGAENFLRLNDPKYERLIESLALISRPDTFGRTTKPPTPKMKKLCTEALRHLLDQNVLIPLGRIHFTILADTRFKGWSLNEMNQLDLAHLRYQP